MKNNKNKVSLITIVASVIVITLTLTYAFLSTEIPPFTNEPTNIVGNTAEGLYLTYTDCADSDEESCSNISKNLGLGESVVKTFKIKNDSLGNSSFDLYFKELQNTFKNGALVYKIENIDTNEELVPETEVPESLEKSEKISIKKSIPIAKDQTQNYRMTITFKSIDANQNENLNAVYSIKLSILPSGK